MAAMQVFELILVHFLTQCATMDLGSMPSFGSLQPNKEFRVDQFGNCPGTAKAPVLTNYTNLRVVNNVIIFNGSVTARRNINEDMMITSKIEKCEKREGKVKADCVHIAEFSAKDYCDVIENRDSWRALLKNFQPRWKCPIKKGVYTASECEFDISSLTYLPVTKGFYRMTTQLRGEISGRLIACMLSEGRLVAKESP